MQVSISSEGNMAVDGKVIGRKVIDKLYQTYSSELAEKRFAYDGEKCLYTVGPLPKNKVEFTVILEDSTAKRWLHYQNSCCFCLIFFIFLLLEFPELSQIPLLCSCGSPSNNGGLSESSKRSKLSLQSRTFKVEISYATKIPLKSLSLALHGAEIEYVQDALRVLDIILRQQAAKRYTALPCGLYIFS